MGISRGAGRKTVLTESGKSDLKFRLPFALSICLLAVQAVFRLWEPKIGILIVVPIEGFVVGPGVQTTVLWSGTNRITFGDCGAACSTNEFLLLLLQTDRDNAKAAAVWLPAFAAVADEYGRRRLAIFSWGSLTGGSGSPALGTRAVIIFFFHFITGQARVPGQGRYIITGQARVPGQARYMIFVKKPKCHLDRSADKA